MVKLSSGDFDAVNPKYVSYIQGGSRNLPKQKLKNTNKAFSMKTKPRECVSYSNTFLNINMDYDNKLILLRLTTGSVKSPVTIKYSLNKNASQAKEYSSGIDFAEVVKSRIFVWIKYKTRIPVKFYIDFKTIYKCSIYKIPGNQKFPDKTKYKSPFLPDM